MAPSIRAAGRSRRRRQAAADRSGPPGGRDESDEPEGNDREPDPWGDPEKVARRIAELKLAGHGPQRHLELNPILKLLLGQELLDRRPVSASTDVPVTRSSWEPGSFLTRPSARYSTLPSSSCAATPNRFLSPSYHRSSRKIRTNHREELRSRFRRLIDDREHGRPVAPVGDRGTDGGHAFGPWTGS